ncbi:uridine kinase [Knoellia sp. CPCC 206453]|uniref:uridine kinase n=1 Tax=Knoellia pratensis TaxID=3404796 RepID=UPI003B42B274
MTAAQDRTDVMDRIARHLVQQQPGQRLRVGIDGVCGVGKTTFAGELAAAVESLGRPAIHVDSDGFHHVRERRYLQGRESARGYYEDAYDFDSLAQRVLLPLGPGGSGEFATTVHDLVSDAVIADAVATAPTNAVVLFAATFIQRDGLRALWDEVIHLDADEEAAMRRGTARDADRMGGVEQARAAYDSRYMAACRIYLVEQDPRSQASIVVDHTDPQAPILCRMGQ